MLVFPQISTSSLTSFVRAKDVGVDFNKFDRISWVFCDWGDDDQILIICHLYLFQSISDLILTFVISGLLLMRAAREAAIWELEEEHLNEKTNLARRQLKDLFFLKRHQMMTRHGKVTWEFYSVIVHVQAWFVTRSRDFLEQWIHVCSG